MAYERLRPTYTHEAVKKLVDLDLVKHVISQNGDGLHGLSGTQITQTPKFTFFFYAKYKMEFFVGKFD